MHDNGGNRPQAFQTVHRFFEKRMAVLEAGTRRPALCAEAQCRHAVGHLVERTVARASLLATVHRSAAASSTSASWKHHLMTAALTELRTLDL